MWNLKMDQWKQLSWAGFSIASLFFVSCGREALENVEPDSVRQHYSVTINEGANTIVGAHLEFGQGGFPVRLQLEKTPKASLKANGEILLGSLDTDYVRMFPGERFENELSYTDKNGKSYVNTAIVTKVVFGKPMPTEISKSAVTEIPWEGAPLRDGEELTLEIIGSNATGLHTETITATRANPKLMLGAKELTMFTKASSTLVLDRHSTQQVANGTSRGGDIDVKYVARTVSMTIKN